MRLNDIQNEGERGEGAGVVVGKPTFFHLFVFFRIFARQDEGVGAATVCPTILAGAGFAFVCFGTAAAFELRRSSGFEIEIVFDFGVIRRRGQKSFAFLVCERKRVMRSADSKKLCK